MPDYSQEDYTDEEEYQDNFLDEQREMWDEAQGNYPSAKKPDSLYSLFQKVWRTSDSSKVANLDPKTELGDLGLSVRECQNIAWFSRFLGHKGVSRYFNKLGEITLSTSMSKKGWFVELFVTSKKFAHKGVKPIQAGESKWKLYGRKTPEEQV